MATMMTDESMNYAPDSTLQQESERRSSELVEFRRPPWQDHFQDILECHFSECSTRIQTASQEDLQTLKVSLLSTAITASFCRDKQISQIHEQELIHYTKALMERGVDPNDTYLPSFYLGPQNRSAVGTAAYYGYTKLLDFLLVEAKCSIASGHALEYAVSNRQHDCMNLLFDHCSKSLISRFYK